MSQVQSHGLAPAILDGLVPVATVRSALLLPTQVFSALRQLIQHGIASPPPTSVPPRAATLRSSITRQQKREPVELEDDENQQYFVLPTPASPFPSAPLTPPTRTLTPLTTRSVIPLTSKWHTIAALETPVHEYAPHQHSSPTPTGQTLNMDPQPRLVHPATDSASTTNQFLDRPDPRTPAYPAYPNSPALVPPTPFWQTTVSQQSGPGTVGPSVEVRRERGGRLPDRQSEQAPDSTGHEMGGEPIVVSVGLLLAPHHRGGGKKARAHAAGELYPLDQFTLDIFVSTQSSWTRRFEVNYPGERRRRRQANLEGAGGGGKGEVRPPGIIPLENCVRISPLLPSTCQSARMDFLALAPGVH
ncbi:hypothetical protein C8T65DRAFT_746107 [Cerioporus squamosus]|nr:hypothetical protein C8T65DRAFT_746107 [Cerioporus squamosus]